MSEHHEYLPMNSDPAGRTRNMPLALSSHLFPLYEAVVNSIQSIGDRPEGYVNIKIKHDTYQRTLDKGRKVKRVTGFTIEDNGDGFNEPNFKSFNTSDSRLKVEQGCRGIGRFYWPQAFYEIFIESVFETDVGKTKRTFNFSENGVYNLKLEETDSPRKTVIKLAEYRKEYSEECLVGVTPIAKKVLNHCMSYFIGENAPDVVLSDEEERVSLRDLFAEYSDLITKFEVKIKDALFKVCSIKVYGSLENGHALALCADRREVRREQILKNYPLTDSGGKYHIISYIFSEFLNSKILPNRNTFDIPEHRMNNEISFDEIKFELTQSIKKYFENELSGIENEREKIVNVFLENNPEYSTVPIERVIDRIKTDMTDEQIEDIFAETETVINRTAKKDAKRLVNKRGKDIFMSEEEQEKILRNYTETQKNALAKYIIRRREVLDVYEQCLAKNEDENYEDEELFHNILFPKKTTSDEVDVIDECNLWILDERLNYFEFATSDKQMRGISDSTSEESLDVLVFAEKVENGFVKEVAIIELKKPENYDRGVEQQVFKYVDLVKDTKAFDYKRHKIILKEDAWFYCYIICDTTDKMLQKILREMEYYPLYGGRGYYKLHKEIRAHVEFIDHRRLIIDAKSRNKVFFEKLGKPESNQ